MQFFVLLMCYLQKCSEGYCPIIIIFFLPTGACELDVVRSSASRGVTLLIESSHAVYDVKKLYPVIFIKLVFHSAVCRAKMEGKTDLTPFSFTLSKAER